MPTTITTYIHLVGRGAITVNESVEDVSRAANDALGQGGRPFIVLRNTSGAQVAIRADSIHGIFESQHVIEEPEVTIGRAGFGAAMMQMNAVPGIDSGSLEQESDTSS